MTVASILLVEIKMFLHAFNMLLSYTMKVKYFSYQLPVILPQYMNVVKLKHEVCYQTYEVGILHHSFLKNFVEIFLNSIFSSLSLKLKTTLNIKFSKLSIFKTKQGLNGYNLIKISPYISLSVWFCRS